MARSRLGQCQLGVLRDHVDTREGSHDIERRLVILMRRGVLRLQVRA